MLRQASSRNHRSKGFKVKHALQICLLVAICIWLLYQVKHSHEKKRAFEERNSKISNKIIENQAEFFKFGRKDLPHTEEKGSVSESHSKEDENEEIEEEHDIKQEEHDIKQEEMEDEEGSGAGDDEIDEQDQDKGDEETEYGEESIDEEDKDSHDEDKDNHDEIDMFDNQEHEGGTQEAREENYKRDDASSAVANETHETESETGAGAGAGAGEAANADGEEVVDKVDDDSGANGSKHDDDSSDNGTKGDDGASADGSIGEVVAENVEKKVVEPENVTKGSDDGSRGDNDLSAGSRGASVSNVSDTVVSGTIQTGNLSSNVTAADNKDVEVEFSKPDNGTVFNSTAVEGNSQMEQQTSLTMAAESNSPVELQTIPTGASDHQIEMQNNSTVFDPAGISTSNDTTILVSAQNQNITTDNATPAEDAHNSQNVEGQGENSNTTSVLESEEHSTPSTTDENEDVAQGGSDNSEHATITEEKDARTDLSTLPDIQNEEKTTAVEAAE